MSALIHSKTITVDGLSVRYAEGGQDGPDAIVMSPRPESVYAFEPAWPHLAAAARLVAIDPPGFRGSDYRQTLMNPKAMGHFISSLLITSPTPLAWITPPPRDVTKKPTPSPTGLPSIIVGLVIAFVAAYRSGIWRGHSSCWCRARWMRRGSTLQRGLTDALRRYPSSAARMSRPEHLA